MLVRRLLLALLSLFNYCCYGILLLGGDGGEDLLALESEKHNFVFDRGLSASQEEEPLPMNAVLDDISQMYERLPTPLALVTMTTPNFGDLIQSMNSINSIKIELDKMQSIGNKNKSLSLLETNPAVVESREKLQTMFGGTVKFGMDETDLERRMDNTVGSGRSINDAIFVPSRSIPMDADARNAGEIGIVDTSKPITDQEFLAMRLKSSYTTNWSSSNRRAEQDEKKVRAAPQLVLGKWPYPKKPIIGGRYKPLLKRPNYQYVFTPMQWGDVKQPPPIVHKDLLGLSGSKLVGNKRRKHFKTKNLRKWLKPDNYTITTTAVNDTNTTTTKSPVTKTPEIITSELLDNDLTVAAASEDKVVVVTVPPPSPRPSRPPPASQKVKPIPPFLHAKSPRLLASSSSSKEDTEEKSWLSQLDKGFQAIMGKLAPVASSGLAFMSATLFGL